jgi:adenosylcobinamide-phosphate synthase
MNMDPALVLVALALEAAIGYPQWLFARIRHPVVWAGHLVAMLERCWNDEWRSAAARRSLGVVAMLTAVSLAAGVGYAMELLCADSWLGNAGWVLIATTGLAQRSLHTHVGAVRTALAAGNVAAARSAVAAIVGRDTEQLSESQVTAAALESLAESYNDAVVAPAFWLLIGGLPGLFVYKAINTGDSMIGHLELRWRSYGWATARTDDLMNLLPARCAGLLLSLCAGGGLAVMLRDAAKHASPNAGWPEAALAGGLGVQLGGPTHYDGVLQVRPTFGDGPQPLPADLDRGLRIYVRACLALWLSLALLAAAL